MEVVVAVDNPSAADVRSLLAVHVAYSRRATPLEHAYALDAEQLVDPEVTFFAARVRGQLVGVAALKRLDARHVELKSMHVAETERRQGVGRMLVAHLLAFASRVGYHRVSLETGSTDEFIAARRLYTECGFRPCEPYGQYVASPYNTFMTIVLGRSTPEQTT
jgi:putative acetyltransferase